jgi:hypothetical protein
MQREGARVGKALFFFFAISACIGVYFMITSIQGLMAAQEEVEKAEREYISALENEAAVRDRYDNLVKYGCENPKVIPGLVSCP